MQDRLLTRSQPYELNRTTTRMELFGLHQFYCLSDSLRPSRSHVFMEMTDPLRYPTKVYQHHQEDTKIIAAGLSMKDRYQTALKSKLEFDSDVSFATFLFLLAVDWIIKMGSPFERGQPISM